MVYKAEIGQDESTHLAQTEQEYKNAADFCSQFFREIEAESAGERESERQCAHVHEYVGSGIGAV